MKKANLNGFGFFHVLEGVFATCFACPGVAYHAARNSTSMTRCHRCNAQDLVISLPDGMPLRS